MTSSTNSSNIVAIFQQEKVRDTFFSFLDPIEIGRFGRISCPCYHISQEPLLKFLMKLLQDTNMSERLVSEQETPRTFIAKHALPYRLTARNLADQIRAFITTSCRFREHFYELRCFFREDLSGIPEFSLSSRLSIKIILPVEKEREKITERILRDVDDLSSINPEELKKTVDKIIEQKTFHTTLLYMKPLMGQEPTDHPDDVCDSCEVWKEGFPRYSYEFKLPYRLDTEYLGERLSDEVEAIFNGIFTLAKSKK